MFEYVGVGVQDVLYQVVAQIMSSPNCRALDSLYMSYLTDNMFCVWYTDASQNVCMLSGSSLVCRQGDTWWQHGFSSWGSGPCMNVTLPEVHASVVKYLPWIEQNTGGQFQRILIACCHAAHSNKDHRVLFEYGPNAQNKSKTAAILEKSKNGHISATV